MAPAEKKQKTALAKLVKQSLKRRSSSSSSENEESVLELKRKLKALRKGPRKQSPNEENIKPIMLEDFAIEIVPMSQENGVMYSESIANGTLRRINFDDEEDQLYGRDYIGDTMVDIGNYTFCRKTVLNMALGSSHRATHVGRKLFEGVFKLPALLESTLTGTPPRAQGKERQNIPVKQLNVRARTAVTDYAMAKSAERGWEQQNMKMVERAMTQRLGELKRANGKGVL